MAKIDFSQVRTLSERFGFRDSDLTTPGHDRIMVWLDGNIVNVLRPFIKGRLLEAKTEWEFVVKSGNYTIGFVDMLVRCLSEYDCPCPLKPCKHSDCECNRKPPHTHTIDPRRLLFSGEDGVFAIEVKTTIPSLGECIRQLQMYRSNLPGNVKIMVVSPDTRFFKQLESQGFLTVEAPS